MSRRVVSLLSRLESRAPDHDPNRSRMPDAFCERVARQARAEVERIEETEICLRAGDILAELIVAQLAARVNED